MTNNRLIYFIGTVLALTVFSCGFEPTMKPVDPYIFLHDNSSKVWLVEKLLINNNDYTPFRFQHKQLIVFHETRNAYFYRLKNFGTKMGLRTYFWMNRAEKEFGFQFDKKEWLFEIRQMSRKKIVLRPKNQTYPYTMVLVPFPER